MSQHWASKAVWTAALLAGLLISAALYTYQLDRVPAFLTLDEAHFSVHAASLAETGRNLNGHVLPPVISLDDPEGEPFDLPWGSTHYLPFGMYLIAGALKVMALSEAAVRLPSALLGGVINVALTFAVALALFRNRTAALASAAALALAPANLIISRQALDSVCQPLFALGGLWCMAVYLRKPDPRVALLCGAVLGCGVYAYVTSVMVMPFYLALFWLVAWREGTLDGRALGWSIAGFVVVLLPLAAWLSVHRDVVTSLQIQYNRADPGSSTLMESLRNGGVYAAVSDTLRIYWSYFDPGFLFVEGGNNRNLSTGRTGVFPWAVAVLMPIGIYGLRTNRRLQLLLLIGLLAAPIPAVIKGAPYAIQRASGLLIFASLLAGWGLATLASGKLMARVAAALLVAVTIWQFAGFYRDYQGRYRIASAQAYDPTAFRGVAEMVLSADDDLPAAAVYMPLNHYDAGAKWRFYTKKHDRMRLWERTRYFRDLASAGAIPANTIAVLPQAGSAGAIPDGWRLVGVVNDLGDQPVAMVIRN